VSLFADVLHLLAAGFWVAGLVLLLENVRREPANKRHFISAATVPFSSIMTFLTFIAKPLLRALVH
jgi:putative copper export protein